MEDVVGGTGFWRNRSVLITGHTGFKGSWLALWLETLGARVTGLALAPPTQPAMFEVAGVGAGMERSHLADVRDLAAVTAAVTQARPEVVFHLAAQPIVLRSYVEPVETYATNVMGVAHLLEAVRHCDSVRAVVMVTSDKCYENREWVWGYRETDAMGGFDPYSSSKGCSELVTAAYRSSYFNPANYGSHGVAVASVRAGNVVGGGDWAEDRLIPDLVRGLIAGKPVPIRNPHAVRPWQHVLEPLFGYLRLAQLLVEQGSDYAEAWNFGPLDRNACPVGQIVDRVMALWDGSTASGWVSDRQPRPHENVFLKLDCSKANARLGWRAQWDIETTLRFTINWYQKWQRGEDMRAATLNDIRAYVAKASES
ncbi:MAG: CDP-glucose 4,6-dehydratase [Alphaproteobacteria bacterium]|nr:CDP-glucose 4,6-dehydratase [Alphaproteobacteria bacterium]